MRAVFFRTANFFAELFLYDVGLFFCRVGPASQWQPHDFQNPDYKQKDIVMWWLVDTEYFKRKWRLLDVYFVKIKCCIIMINDYNTSICIHLSIRIIITFLQHREINNKKDAIIISYWVVLFINILYFCTINNIDASQLFLSIF